VPEPVGGGGSFHIIIQQWGKDDGRRRRRLHAKVRDDYGGTGRVKGNASDGGGGVWSSGNRGGQLGGRAVLSNKKN